MSKRTFVCISLHHKKTRYKNFKEVRDLDTKDFYEKVLNFADSCVIVKTSTRFEIYADLPVHDYIDKILNLVPKKEMHDLFDIYKDKDAVYHLFSLTACIVSRVLGESSIPLRVEDSFKHAKEIGAANSTIELIFNAALKMYKRAKTETELFNNSELVSKAIEKLLDNVEELNGKTMLLWGSGRSGRNIAELIKRKYDVEMFVTNRIREISERIAERLNAKIINYEEVPDIIGDVDVLICASLASHKIVTEKRLKNVERYKHLYILDVSPFKNVDEALAKRDKIFLIDVREYVERNYEKMRGEVGKVRKIVEEEVNKMARKMQWKSLQ